MADTRCIHYDEHTYGEPPLEPDENGTLVTERQCKNASGYFEPMCDGNTEMCDLPDNQNKVDLARNIAKGEQKRRDTNYDEIEARILAKLKKLPSYDLDWVECMINHLIARTQQPPEPPRMDERPESAPTTREPFKGTDSNPMPLGGQHETP